MSDWVNYVKQYARQHGITYGEALKKAGPSYRRGGVVVGGKKKKSSHKKKKSKSMNPKRYCRSGSKVMGGRKPSKKRVSSKRVGSSRKAYTVGRGLSEMFGGCNSKMVDAFMAGMAASK